jgi:glutathione S-transferase
VLLIGMLDSPFVRRVAISMRVHGLNYEHGNWSVGRDFERIRQYSPLGRVPALVLDDGAVLCESAAILDYLDEQVGAARALLPAAGIDRRQCLQLMALATGAAESARDAIYEKLFRPAEKVHQPWLDRRLLQMHAGLAELDQRMTHRSAARDDTGKLTQAEVSVTCCYSFISDTMELQHDPRYPALRELAAHWESTPHFKATRTIFFSPKPA